MSFRSIAHNPSHLIAVIDEFDRTVREEIDFGAEARNLQRFGSFVGSRIPDLK